MSCYDDIRRIDFEEDFELFQMYVKKKLTDMLSEENQDVEVSLHTVTNNDNVKLHGVRVRKRDSNIESIIYLKDYYTKSTIGIRLDSIMFDIAKKARIKLNLPDKNVSIANQMKVTNVRLFLTDLNPAVKAIGSFSLNDVFAVRGVRVMENKEGGNFVSFPCREKQDGSYEDIAFPTSKEFYEKITEAILMEYQQLVKQKEQEWDKSQIQSPDNAALLPKRRKGR